MTYRRRITVALDDDLIARLDRAAERRVVSRNLIAAAAISTFLDHLDDDDHDQPLEATVTPPATPPRPARRPRRWWQPR